MRVFAPVVISAHESKITGRRVRRVPKPGDGKLAFPGTEIVRLAGFRVPFKEAGGRNNAPLAFKGCAKQRLFFDGFGAGVDHWLGRRAFRPRGQETPLHPRHLPLIVAPEDGDNEL